MLCRGFGDTRFRSPDTLRSGQQGALGQDAIELMDALEHRPSGRSAVSTGAGEPLVSRQRCAQSGWPGWSHVGGYNIQDIARSAEPVPPGAESAAWYTHYFLTDRGRRRAGTLYATNCANCCGGSGRRPGRAVASAFLPAHRACTTRTSSTW